jgi:arylsulfatase A-like enzyme
MAEKTNVIVVLSDDQGVWAAGCYGNPEIRTPNIDKLAATGTRFENFFIATPVCSPSRATLFTGRIPSQHGLHDWIAAGDVGPDAIRYMKDEEAYTDIMVRHGYTCGISGKWHMGDSQAPQFGFTDWYVHQKGGSDYNAAPMVRDGELVTEQGYITDLITDQALKMLDSYSKNDNPFYLSVHYTAPHSPWTGHPREIVDSYDDCKFESCPQDPRHPWAIWLTDENLGNRESLKGYFAAVTAMDENIGRILNALKAKGLRENTLVVFLSDNGFSCGQHGFWGKGNGTIPYNLYENSIKVPAIFSHPGKIPQGRVEDAMVSAYDFMPTLLGYLDLPLPEEKNLPGKSFLPALKGNSIPGHDEVVIFDEYGPVRMIRTRQWKLVHRHPDGPHELFNLLDDPGELKNLAGDIDQSDRIKQLKSKMDRWFARYVIESRDGLRRACTVDGQKNIMR